MNPEFLSTDFGKNTEISNMKIHSLEAELFMRTDGQANIDDHIRCSQFCERAQEVPSISSVLLQTEWKGGRLIGGVAVRQEVQ